MSFLRFSVHALGESRTTQTWTVLSASASLGEVRWYSPWRRYAFYPAPGTVFDTACLEELANFVSIETKKQEATWK